MTLFSPLLPVEQKLRAVKDYKDYEQYALNLIEQRREDRRDEIGLRHGPRWRWCGTGVA